MKIEITTNDTFDPEKTIVIINGNQYKTFKSLKLVIAEDNHGSFAVQHENGFLEAYKAKEKNTDVV